MFRLAPELKKIAEEVLRENVCMQHMTPDSPRIEYMWSDKEKKSNGKLVYADTEKLSDKVKELCQKDFIITFYSPNCQYLNEEKLKILMEHELLHVGWEPEEERCYIRPHDVGDFDIILEKHGAHWISN